MRLRWRARSIVLLATVAGALLGASAADAVVWSNSVHCAGYGSGDRCWVNYDSAHRLAYEDARTQYSRDQVCAKARDNVINGPVSPGSACTNGNLQALYFTYPDTWKKGYVYWAGNGGGIWIDGYARTNDY